MEKEVLINHEIITIGVCMSGITTSTATSNVFTTSKCDKKNTKSSTSTFSRVSGFFSSAKNTSTQQSSKPSTSKPSASLFGEPSSSKKNYKTYKVLEGNANVKIDRGLLSGVKKIPGGVAIEGKDFHARLKGCSNVTIGSTTQTHFFKQSSQSSTSSFSSRPSSNMKSVSKEKTRTYSSLEEAAKKEKGVKIEKKGRSTNVTISGVSGLHIGKTKTHTLPSPKVDILPALKDGDSYSVQTGA